MATTTKKKPGQLTMKTLRTWLKKQDPEGEYDYYTPENCLMAQFSRAQGYDVGSAGTWFINLTNGTKVNFDSQMDLIVAYCRPLDGRRTYGSALKALEAYLKEKKGA